MTEFHVSAMSQYDELKKPFLTKKDEEYQMLLEVAEECIQQKREKTAQKKSGTATEVVVREHLLRRGFNLTFKPDVKVQGSNIKNDLFLLESMVNPDLKEYAPNEVHMVVEIKNNAAANQSKLIKEKFDELKKLSPNLRFAVVILSEKTGFPHAITDEKLGDEKYLSFTLVARRIYPKSGGLFSGKAIMDLLKDKEMKKTGDWERFMAYLKAT
jgi:hypothetical protein